MKPGNHTDSLVLNVRPADKRPPQLFVAVTPNVLAPPYNRMVEVVATIQADDNQDSQPRIRLEAITHNEANDATGNVEGAEFGADDRQFSLRAVRTRRCEEPRVYKVVYSATDRSGNKCFAEAYVTVPHRR